MNRNYALLIEDNEALATEIRLAVEECGLTIEVANTWDDGLAKFNALSPDLVIADYNLPGSRHGLTLLLAIARVRPSVTLVLLSAYLNEDDVARVQALGLVDHVMRKTGSPAKNARDIIELVRVAAANADRPTDWRAFAESALRARLVSDDALAELDGYLQQHRFPASPTAK